jgi:hypothetical protein
MIEDRLLQQLYTNLRPLLPAPAEATARLGDKLRQLDLLAQPA